MPYQLGTATAWEHKEASREVEKCKDEREPASKQTYWLRDLCFLPRIFISRCWSQNQCSLCFLNMQLVWLCMHQWCLHTWNGWAQLLVCIQEASQVLCRCPVCWWIFNFERKYWESIRVVLFSCYSSAWDSLYCWNKLLASCLFKICATDSHCSFSLSAFHCRTISLMILRPDCMQILPPTPKLYDVNAFISTLRKKK